MLMMLDTKTSLHPISEQNKKPKVKKEVEDIFMSDEEENEDSDIGEEEDGDDIVSDNEEHSDDVHKALSLPSKAPRELKGMDENQSKKGLAELCADEYAQNTDMVSQALSFSDEQKKEASLLFKKLCLKLDALSPFHFTPKPVSSPPVPITGHFPATHLCFSFFLITHNHRLPPVHPI